MHDILTPKQMRFAEEESVKLGVSLAELMDNAGAKLARCIINYTKRFIKRRVVILVGSGNNGGDGLVAANFLVDEGIMPIIILCCGLPKSELALNAYNNLNRNVVILDKSDEKIMRILYTTDIIVDCIFGTGFHGSLESELSEFISRINDINAYKIACDVPSGVNSLSGQIAENTFIADETITFHRGKVGMFISPAKECCGKIDRADIGIPNGWQKEIGVSISYATVTNALRLLPKRPSNSHKGTFGKCSLVCGSGLYPGAAIISSMSALRSGVGIVNLCTPVPPWSLVSVIPEATFTPLKSDEQGFLTIENIPLILEKLESSNAAVIGCGLGNTPETQEVVKEIIRNAKCKLIIDADGINCLSEHIDVLREKQTEIILTPHVGELARLCNVTIADILSDNLGYAKQLTDNYGVIVHSKNTQTLTVAQDKCVISDFGCSALAKGGSGDMLAGLIGSLVAQGLSGENACVLADYIMGKTANLLCETNSPRGLLATDIIAGFPKMLCQAERGVIV